MQPSMNFMRTSIEPPRGFSLLEVLVAIVVLSIGLLGMAALQSYSIKNNQSAAFRSQAMNLAYGIIDNMRANRTGVLHAEYYTTYSEATPSGTTVAKQDLINWKAAISNVLPQGQGQIDFPGTTVTVNIQWDDSRITSSSNIFSLTTTL
jgi:type IV pilus assembly protein PilV